ncbi:MAG: Dyp-type peroxidase [Opitutae bacterium]|nr:Dyp-type peroxidase [Opitutae bacterium]
MPLEFPASVPFEPTVHQEFLSAIQGNILKPHGRMQVRLVFFAGLSTREQARALLAEALRSGRVTSAWQQREQADLRKAGGGQAFFYGVMLTKEFFWATASADFPPEGTDAFRTGAYSRAADPSKWDQPYRQHPQGLWLVAHDETDQLKDEVARVEKMLRKHGAKILRRPRPASGAAPDPKPGTEAGFRWHDAGERDAMREPFGFRDGLSDSAFLQPQPAAPRHVQIGLAQLLIGDGAHAGGSFFVLQKLDQNVAAFRRFEGEIAKKFTALGRPLPAREAGALLVGRERDGQPLVDGVAAGSNAFDFDGDATAARCPFHAHIRKANPRTTTLPNEGLLERQFARRSAIYDERGQLPAHAAPDYPEGAAIAGDVGLLFMGYMRDVQSQFEHMRRTWFEDDNFPFANSTPDPVLVGAGAAGGGEWRWNQAGVAVPGLSSFVRNRGTLFGYAPSILWLRRFAAETAP